jgi:AraC-like DNA-binding protein
MRYREHHPQAPLNRFVECFWTLESDGLLEQTQPERILPDGCVELILNFGDRFLQHNGNLRVDQPRNFLVGQMTGPILISPKGFVQLMGIRFHPGGSLPFLRTPLHDLTDQVVELGGLASHFESQLLSASVSEPTMQERVAAIEAILLTYVGSFKNDSFVPQLAARIVETGGLTSIDQLAIDAGVSTRQLERRFLREVGLGPKLLSRILRFQQVFRAVDQCDGAWAPVAVECGYYDQAHLIRDFNQFAQQTPAVLLAEQTSLTESFTRKSRTSHFSNTPS